MLVKSLVVSVAAALLGPTLGIATFFLTNGNSPNSHSFSASVQTTGLLAQPDHREVTRTFAPSGAWYGPSAQERKLDTAAADLRSGLLGVWQTVVNCPEGQALSEDGRCRSSSSRPPT
jgi:hypothetical protein